VVFDCWTCSWSARIRFKFVSYDKNGKVGRTSYLWDARIWVSLWHNACRYFDSDKCVSEWGTTDCDLWGTAGVMNGDPRCSVGCRAFTWAFPGGLVSFESSIVYLERTNTLKSLPSLWYHAQPDNAQARSHAMQSLNAIKSRTCQSMPLFVHESYKPARTLYKFSAFPSIIINH
jgi:hypothetical protein